MKKLVLSLFLFAFTAMLTAQNLSLTYLDEAIPANSTIMVTLDPGEEVVTAYIGCTNNSSASIGVKTKKIIYEGDTLAGSGNYFCWGACFPPFVYVSPTTLPIEPGATSNDFYADYEPNNIPGVSQITYVFFDAENTDDSVAITVQWNASPAGIGNDLLNQVSFSNAYPNPASSTTHVDYDLPEGMENSTLVVTNMLGAKVKELPLNGMNGRLEIPVYDLQDGIYFYTLKANNTMAMTKKFVVRH